MSTEEVFDDAPVEPVVEPERPQPEAPPAAMVAAITAAAPTPVSVVSTEPRSSERGSRGRRAKPPFRLCFMVPGVAGRSALPPASTHAAPANAVTGKFYSREEEKIRAQLLQILEEERAEREAAGEKPEPEGGRGRDLLESARYGRYPRPLVAPGKGDRRLHFANRTSEMVRVQCQIARAAALAGTGTTAGGHGSRGRQGVGAAVAQTG